MPLAISPLRKRFLRDAEALLAKALDADHAGKRRTATLLLESAANAERAAYAQDLIGEYLLNLAREAEDAAGAFAAGHRDALRRTEATGRALMEAHIESRWSLARDIDQEHSRNERAARLAGRKCTEAKARALCAVQRYAAWAQRGELE